MSSRAHPGPLGKRQVPGARPSIELEFLRPLPFPGIDVCRGPSQVQLRTLGHSHPLEQFVPAGDAGGQALGRRAQAHALFRESPHLVAVSFQFVPDAVSFDQQLHLFRQRVLGCFQPADDHCIDDSVDFQVLELALQR